MEKTCTRCHQTVHEDNCYCPVCGLPQLTYASDSAPAGPAPAEPWGEAVVRDADTIAWKPALRSALILAVPAGMLSSEPSPLGGLGMMWTAVAAAWAVILYMRSERPAWITVGAGARIGLVTGIMAAWLAFSISGAAVFVDRFVLHRSSQMDAEWKSRVELSQQMTAGITPADTAQSQAFHAQFLAWQLSPEGRAGMWAGELATGSFFLLLFAAGGGALGARMIVRRRRSEM